MELLSTIYKWLSCVALRKAEPEVRSHIDAICAAHADYQASCPLPDNYPPHFAPSDGRLVSKMISPLISYYVTERAFIKRQPHTNELGLDMYGNPAVSPYSANRLRNEAAVLRYLRAKTTIPVPELLDVQTMNGLVYLKMAWVSGAVELHDIPAARMDAAIAAVSAQLESQVFPQLRNLRSNRMGSPDPELLTIPPRRFWDWKESRVWPSIPGKYTFCHLDLDRQNILVHPETYKIVAIIDWEMAGFFPPEWELELWKQKTREEKYNLIESAKERESGFFSDWLSTQENTQEKKD